MFRKYVFYILTSLLVIFCSILGYNNRSQHNDKSSSLFQDTGLNSNSSNFHNIVWYQIIPDKRANGNKDNDGTSRPLDRGNLSGTYNNLSLQEARNQSGVSGRSKDRFILTELEKNIAEAYHKNSNITPALATASVLRNRWFGGDLKGIQDNIGYLQDLGVNGILLQPIWIADSPIRYDVKDWRHVDPRLTNEFDNTKGDFEDYIHSGYASGREWTQSDQEFFETIEQLHKANIKVVLDMSLLYAGAHNYLIEDVARHGKKSPYYDRFYFADEQEKTPEQSHCNLGQFYDIQHYPLANGIYYQGRRGHCPKIYIRKGLGKHGIHDGLYKYYVSIFERRLGSHTINSKKYKGADGIRLDAYGEFDHKLVKAIRQEIKQINPQAILMAEERLPNIQPIEDGQADTISFYPIRGRSEALIIQQGRGLIEGVASLTRKIEEFYHTITIKPTILMNYLSSHDTDRILSRFIYTNRDLAISYFRQEGSDSLWDKGHYARDSPRISRSDHSAHYIHTSPSQEDIALVHSAIAFQFIMPGSPVIYYGDEKGMFGADDPDNRQPMRRDIANHFPRSACQRSTNPIQYCTTSGQDSYTSYTDLYPRYQTMTKLKHSSSAIRNGSLSLSLCYKNNDIRQCTNNNQAHAIWGVERQGTQDSIIYISLLEHDIISDTFAIKVPSNYNQWTNIKNQKMFTIDSEGYIMIGKELREQGFLILQGS